MAAGAGVDDEVAEFGPVPFKAMRIPEHLNAADDLRTIDRHEHGHLSPSALRRGAFDAGPDLFQGVAAQAVPVKGLAVGELDLSDRHEALLEADGVRRQRTPLLAGRGYVSAGAVLGSNLGRSAGDPLVAAG